MASEGNHDSIYYLQAINMWWKEGKMVRHLIWEVRQRESSRAYEREFSERERERERERETSYCTRHFNEPTPELPVVGYSKPTKQVNCEPKYKVQPFVKNWACTMNKRKGNDFVMEWLDRALGNIQ